MAFNKLTSEEEDIIEGKGTERPFLVSMMIFTKMGFLSAKNVTLLFFLQSQSLMLVVDGQLLMMNILIP